MAIEWRRESGIVLTVRTHGKAHAVVGLLTADRDQEKVAEAALL